MDVLIVEYQQRCLCGAPMIHYSTYSLILVFKGEINDSDGLKIKSGVTSIGISYLICSIVFLMV